MLDKWRRAFPRERLSNPNTVEYSPCSLSLCTQRNRGKDCALTFAYESNFGDLSLPLDGFQGGILHQEKFEACGKGAGGKTVGSLSRRLDLDVSQNGIVGRGITISRDGRDFLHGVIGWGVVQNS